MPPSGSPPPVQTAAAPAIAPPSDLVLGEADADAAEALAALVRLAFADHVGQVAPPPSAVGETGARIAHHLAQGGTALMLVARAAAGDDEGDRSHAATPVAACLYHPVPGGLHIARLAVAPERRRQGLARLLLGEVERRARAQGLSRLVLQTRLALASNRALFSRAGFREVSLHAHPGFSEPTFVEMEKRLRPDGETDGPDGPGKGREPAGETTGQRGGEKGAT